MATTSCCFLNALAARRSCVGRLPIGQQHWHRRNTLRLSSHTRDHSIYHLNSFVTRAACNQQVKPLEMSKSSNNGSAYLQVLGLGLDTRDSTPSVLLFFEKQRYLFNAGEGFQRYCVQHKLKLNRMPNILATRASVDAVGGVPGMILTMADSSISQHVANGLGSVSSCHAEIYGPKGIQHLQSAMASYMRMKGVHFHQLGHKSQETLGCSEPVHGSKDGQQSQTLLPVIKNDAVVISAVVLQPEAGIATAGEPNPHKRQKTDNQGSAAAQVQAETPVAACYICCLASVPGKFLPQKAKDLGVPAGPLFGKLKAGIAVMGKDRMVQPDEVLETAPTAPIVIIADCPSSAHLAALVTSPAWGPFMPSKSCEPDVVDNSSQQAVNCIMHLAPEQVVAMPEYQHWMAGFGKSTRHIVLNCMAVPSSVSLPSPSTLQIKLNCIDGKVFPLPQTIMSDCSTSTHSQGQPVLQTPTGLPSLQGSDLMKYNLRPATRVNTVETVDQPLSIAAIQAQLRTEMPEVLEAAQRGGDASCFSGHVPDAIAQAGEEELEVVFLGTGAAMPSKYRNVTSIYINCFSKGGMLLDCGEGTLGQLTRRFGHSKVKEVVCSLACVWVSHIHADHHAGLPRLLAARAEWLGPSCTPLPVFGPWPLEKILRYNAAMQPMPHLFFNQTGLVAQSQQQPSQQMQAATNSVKSQLGLKTLQSLLVVHCAHAYAAILEGKSGWKVVFSGDTRPCEQMVHAAKDATLLIHEATFEDEMVEDALAKRHSLTCEAVQIGAESGAYRTILTHFSQRYPKIPKIEKSFLATTCIAFDLMSINLKDLPQLPSHVPAVALLCKDVDEEADEVAAP